MRRCADYFADTDKYQLTAPAVLKLVEELASKLQGLYRKARVLYE